jgi:hypothetical protein
VPGREADGLPRGEPPLVCRGEPPRSMRRSAVSASTFATCVNTLNSHVGSVILVDRRRFEVAGDHKVHRIATMCRLATPVGLLIFKSATVRRLSLRFLEYRVPRRSTGRSPAHRALPGHRRVHRHQRGFSHRRRTDRPSGPPAMPNHPRMVRERFTLSGRYIRQGCPRAPAPGDVRDPARRQPRANDEFLLDVCWNHGCNPMQSSMRVGPSRRPSAVRSSRESTSFGMRASPILLAECRHGEPRQVSRDHDRVATAG